MNIVLGVCTHAGTSSRIENWHRPQLSTIICRDRCDRRGFAIVKRKYNEIQAPASLLKKKRKKKPIALLRKRPGFYVASNVSLHIAIGISFSLCYSFLVSASSHTWSFSWIAQNTARLNTNREIRPYSLRTVRYC